MARTRVLASVFGMVACVSVPAAAQDGGPPAPLVVGTPAPPLALTGMLQAPGGTPAARDLSWNHFKGQVVVLEFWATWCGPCVAAIPHLNKLAEEFADRPVRFVSVTSEKEEPVRRFLNKRPMRSWIALDSDQTMHRAYGARAIPHTVLIDSAGQIAGITSPQNVTGEVLEDMLAGRRPDLPDLAQMTPGVALAEGDAKPPLFQVLIRATELESGMTGTSAGNLTAQSMSVREMVSVAYGFPHATRIVIPKDRETERYEVVIATPGRTDESMREVFRGALTNAFGLTTRRETRDLASLVVSIPDGAEPRLSTAASDQGNSTRSGPGMFSAANHTLQPFLVHAERMLGMPVVDETRLTGRYDYELSWDEKEPGSLLPAVAEALGLRMRREVRSVEVLVVDFQPPAITPTPSP